MQSWENYTQGRSCHSTTDNTLSLKSFLVFGECFGVEKGIWGDTQSPLLNHTPWPFRIVSTRWVNIYFICISLVSKNLKIFPLLMGESCCCWACVFLLICRCGMHNLFTALAFGLCCDCNHECLSERVCVEPRLILSPAWSCDTVFIAYDWQAKHLW